MRIEVDEKRTNLGTCRRTTYCILLPLRLRNKELFQQAKLLLASRLNFLNAPYRVHSIARELKARSEGSPYTYFVIQYIRSRSADISMNVTK